MKRCFLFIFLFLFLLTPTSYAQNNPPPSWIKAGAYAQYQFTSTGVAFHNHTLIEFKNNATGTFRWECTNLKNQIATLNISLSFNTTKSFALFETVNVNISSREVFSTNGTFIGVTFLWGPTNITDGQNIILWNNPPDKIEGTTSILGNGATPQGLQKAYILQANGTISGKQTQIISFYDIDTGFFIDGYLTNDILLTVTGIHYFGINGMIKFNETNVNLGPSEQQPTTYKQPSTATNNQQPTTNATIMICTTFAAFFILVLTSYHKQKKHKHHHKK